MQLKRAERKKVALKLGMAGPSGSGKTYSSLLLAKGLVGAWEKVAVIDTENGSADLYSDLGPYNTLTLEPPFEPEKFLRALETCEQEGIGAVIIDSLSHEWMGEGGILDYQNKLGGQWKDWAKATPRHRKFMDGILQSPMHIICCARVKTEWVTEKNEKGKTEPRKVGLKVEQREGLEYEFTVAFRLSQTHMAETDKDRTGLFADKPDFKISEATGKQLLAWANSGAAPAPKPTAATPVHAELADDAPYDGVSDTHKNMLREAAKAAGMTKGADLLKLSEECKKNMVPVSMLKAAATEFMSEGAVT